MMPNDERDTSGGRGEGRFATFVLERAVAAPLAVLWQVWTAPAARAVWLPAAEREAARDSGWLVLQPGLGSIGYECVAPDGAAEAAALVTAEFADTGETSRLVATVQRAALAGGSGAAAAREDFAAALDRLAAAAERTLLIERVLRAPRAAVWDAWMNEEALPQWWGPDGYSCRTRRIALEPGGEWVFEMIGPDGTVYPNHHRYGEIQPGERLAYTLLWGENGPKHADAWVAFEDHAEGTRVTLGMVMSSRAEYEAAKGFGALELGLQTLGKLERMVEARRAAAV
ncbi:SRPBCC domain-containing protein [Prosthecomicrobium pneumaticum]|uniref:Uncharacterized protein YndB with AHSA1/START domain n=1 Tax=Prosthecomicrobium pneumaticum TaxID=81895 RepID=A0A7W9FNK3_9HYPH|nr:SRPBCC domain-containing protein [Prosthecomicrobium pneumaticum]MBB5753916.1 uncharacterized protein YndB with AHSA1/START domain [Prosthecomicrobium pneumaticum]